MREPDDDLISYLNYNKDIYALDDIADVLAECPGHNDEDAWYWILRLKDGRFVVTEASCDYTGWDCQSSGQSNFALNAIVALDFLPEDSEYRQVRSNMLAQLEGRQPIGLEDRRLP